MIYILKPDKIILLLGFTAKYGNQRRLIIRFRIIFFTVSERGTERTALKNNLTSFLPPTGGISSFGMFTKY